MARNPKLFFLSKAPGCLRLSEMRASCKKCTPKNAVKSPLVGSDTSSSCTATSPARLLPTPDALTSTAAPAGFPSVSTIATAKTRSVGESDEKKEKEETPTMWQKPPPEATPPIPKCGCSKLPPFQPGSKIKSTKEKEEYQKKEKKRI